MTNCENCKFATLINEEKNLLECRLNPPTPFLLPMPGRLQGQIEISIQTVFPLVNEKWNCSKGIVKWDEKN